MKKSLLSIILLFAITKAVQAETHQGPQCSVSSNPSYPFIITTAGQYAITLDYSIYGPYNGFGGQIKTFGNIGNLSILWAYARPDTQQTGSVSYVMTLQAKGYSIHATIEHSLTADSYWSYNIHSADATDYSQAFSNLTNQLNTLQTSINNQNTSTDNSLADQSQQLADMNNAITNMQAAILASNADIKNTITDQLNSLEAKLLKVEKNYINVLQGQLTNLQNSVDAQGASATANFTAQSQQLSSINSLLTTIQSSLFISNNTIKQSYLDQISLLKSQAIKIQKTIDALSVINSHITSGTGLILGAIHGVSQQVNTVNNNVTTGNSQNQTLGIVGVSLGGAALGAVIGVPLLMKAMSPTNSETEVNVVDSLETDRESLDYISPEQKPYSP